MQAADHKREIKVWVENLSSFPSFLFLSHALLLVSGKYADLGASFGAVRDASDK
jgi:hypothetical protein